MPPDPEIGPREGSVPGKAFDGDNRFRQFGPAMAPEGLDRRERRRAGFDGSEILRVAEGEIRADSRREPPPRAEVQCLINRVRGGLKRSRKDVLQDREARGGRLAAEADLLTHEFGAALQKKMAQEIRGA